MQPLFTTEILCKVILKSYDRNRILLSAFMYNHLQCRLNIYRYIDTF